MTDLTTKELLDAICENPGWSPTEPSGSVATAIDELVKAGMIVSRLDGWEASALAMNGYPHARPKPPPPAPMQHDSRVGMEITLPNLLSIGVGQRIEAPIDNGPLSGGIGLLNKGQGRIEVEVVLRVRTV